MSVKKENKSGITRSSFTALLYAMFVFTPAIIYLYLMTGLTGLSVAWFTLVLWVEMGKFSGKKLTKQEAFIIFSLVGTATFIPIEFVYRAYFVQSDVANFFGLTKEIPDWWAPPLNEGVFEMRTFFHNSWIVPIGLTLTSMFATYLLWFVLAFVGKKILIEVEDLPFPIQQMEAKAIMTLTDPKEKQSSRILFLFASFGFFYGFVVYAFPFMLRAWTGIEMRIVPVPWADFTADMEALGLGGAIFGVATDLSPIATSFVLPLSTVVCIAIGSFSVHFIGNWLIVQYNLSQISWWSPGINAAMTLERSTLYFWMSPLVGLILAVGIVPLFRHPKVLVNAFTYLRQPKTYGSKRNSISNVLIVLYAACIILGLVFFALLSPSFFHSFFFLIVTLLVGLPLVVTLTEGRMRGEAGVVPPRLGRNLTRAIYLSTNYSGTEIWFVPNLWEVTGRDILPKFKLAQLTETSLLSFIKAFWILVPLATAVGFAFVELFWRIAPIPSGLYPGAAIFWPVDAVVQSLWIKGLAQNLFRPDLFLGGFLSGVALFLVNKFTPISLSLTALGVGVNLVTPFAVTYLIGALITLIFKWRLGRIWYEKNRRLVAAGLMMGEGLAIALSVAAALMINAIWARPF